MTTDRKILIGAGVALLGYLGYRYYKKKQYEKMLLAQQQAGGRAGEAKKSMPMGGGGGGVGGFVAPPSSTPTTSTGGTSTPTGSTKPLNPISDPVIPNSGGTPVKPISDTLTATPIKDVTPKPPKGGHVTLLSGTNVAPISSSTPKSSFDGGSDYVEVGSSLTDLH